MEKGLVSIVTPCYNGETYIKRYLDSILNQTYKKLQLIIVNDGSTDDTEKILNDYEEKFEKIGIEYIHIVQKNQGQAAAVNNALGLVKGEFLIWPDSDDYLENNSIENFIKCFKNQDIDYVLGKVAFRKEENIEDIIRIRQIAKRKNLFKNYILNKKIYCYSGVIMVKMNFFEKCIPNRKIYVSRGGQNWQLILPIAYKGIPGYIDDIVYNCVIRKASHSHSIVEKEKKVERNKEHNQILINTLKSIHMKEKERKYYNKLLERVNERNILKVECEFKNIKLVNRQFINIIVKRNLLFEDIKIIFKFYVKRILKR